MDLSFLTGLGNGLQTLGQGLDQREMRRLAKEKQDQEDERQRREDALRQAIASANSQNQLRDDNFNAEGGGPGGAPLSPDAMKSILNQHAMTPMDTVVDPVSGVTMSRKVSERPLSVRQQAEQDKLAAAAELAAVRAQQARDHDAVMQLLGQGRIDASKENTQTRATAQEHVATTRAGAAGQAAGVRASGGGAKAAAQDAKAKLEEQKARDRFLTLNTTPTFDKAGYKTAPKMTREEAMAAWDAMHPKGGSAPSTGVAPSNADLYRKATDEEFKQAFLAAGNDLEKAKAALLAKGLRP